MHQLYDDHQSIAGAGLLPALPENVRRIAGAAVFVCLVAAMGLWAWRLGTRDASMVPVVKAMAGPSRVAPEEPGGLQAAHQGLEVNDVLAGQPAPRIAPAHARPAPEILTAEDAPQGELVVSAPAILAERVMSEAGATTGDEIVALAPADAGIAATAEAPLATELVSPADGEADALAAGPRPMNRPRGLVVARAKPASAEAAPAAKPRVAAEAPAKPRETAKAAPTAAKPAAPATREVASAKAGTRMVQLGAYDSEEMARRAWSRLVAANPDLLGAKSLYAERTTSNARVFYRLRVAGFENTDQTRAMCESLRARGVDCIPVTVQ